LAVIREADLGDILRRRSTAARGLLVYGGDEARVSGVIDQSLKLLAKPEDVTRLQIASLRSDPALLDDALRSQSFLGGRQVVLVEDVTDQHFKLIEPVFQEELGGNFLVLSAGSLSKSSALRTACEASERFFVTPIYEDRPADILELVMKFLHQNKLSLDEEARERFMALCGTDRLLALNEAEKLVLYCNGQQSINVVDVAACCGDQASYGLDGLIDAALAGDSLAADRMLHVLDESEWRSLLPILSSHVARLSNLRGDADRLGGIDAAMRAARPPVFFGRKSAIVQQLKALDTEALIRAQVAVEHTVEQSRRLSDLAPEMISRLLMLLAAEVRRGLRG
jgi:DNA polymerase III subunit delta